MPSFLLSFGKKRATAMTERRGWVRTVPYYNVPQGVELGCYFRFREKERANFTKVETIASNEEKYTGTAVAGRKIRTLGETRRVYADSDHFGPL